jgi:hypothetical protein
LLKPLLANAGVDSSAATAAPALTTANAAKTVRLLF